MNPTHIAKASLASILVVVLSGCASIVDGRPKKVSFNSEPPGATVRITDRKGREVASQQTPAIIPLKRGAGYFSGAKYTVEVALPGYRSETFEIKSSVNGWYFGNVLLGGLIGLIIVDPLTGAMYTLKPKEVNAVLSKTETPTSLLLQQDGGLVVMPRKDVPDEFASRLVSLSK